MTPLNRLSVSQAASQLWAGSRQLPHLILIRQVRSVSAIVLLIVLVSGALAVVALLSVESTPPAVVEPETVLSLDKLTPIEQSITQRQQAGLTGLVVPSRTYFEPPAANP